MTVNPSTLPQSKSRSRFISLRWRVLLPIALVVTLIASVGAYLLASRSGEGVNSFEQNFVLQHTATIQQELNESYLAHRSEARRVAFTVGCGRSYPDQSTPIAPTHFGKPCGWKWLG